MKKLYFFLTISLTFSTITIQAQNWWDWRNPLASPYNNVILDKQNNYITISGKGTSQWDSPAEFSVRKYTRDGILEWQKNGASGGGSTTNVAVDDSGNIYTTGFSTNNLINENLLKFDASGNKLWSLAMMGIRVFVNISGMYATADGDMYVAGSYYDSWGPYYNDSIRLGNLSAPVVYGLSGTQSIVIAKISSQGIPQWLKVFAFPNNTFSGIFHTPIFSSVIKDNNDNLYLSGDFAKGYFELETTTIYAGTNHTGFVMQKMVK
jgi:hypothetical protein